MNVTQCTATQILTHTTAGTAIAVESMTKWRTKTGVTLLSLTVALFPLVPLFMSL